MARLARVAVALGLVMVAVLPAFGMAQGYPHLHVVALAQHVDRSTVDPNGTFTLTIHVKIAQRRERLDELILGSFVNCEIISNETVRSARPDGTDFVERLTLQALVPGEATVSPAYIDAIDPALGKPMRFSSNSIRVHVNGVAPLASVLNTVANRARRLLLAAAIVAGLFAAAFVLFVLFVRRKRQRATVVVSAPAAATDVAPAVATNEGLLRAVQAYQSEPSVALLADVRAMLFERAGVAAGATLVDALQTLGQSKAHLRAALLAAEAAAFGPAAGRPAAGDLMVAAIQAYCAGGSANENAWIR